MRVGRYRDTFDEKVPYFMELIKEREKMLTNIRKAKEKKQRKEKLSVDASTVMALQVDLGGAQPR